MSYNACFQSRIAYKSWGTEPLEWIETSLDTICPYLISGWDIPITRTKTPVGVNRSISLSITDMKFKEISDELTLQEIIVLRYKKYFQ